MKKLIITLGMLASIPVYGMETPPRTKRRKVEETPSPQTPLPVAAVPYEHYTRDLDFVVDRVETLISRLEGPAQPIDIGRDVIEQWEVLDVIQSMLPPNVDPKVKFRITFKIRPWIALLLEEHKLFPVLLQALAVDVNALGTIEDEESALQQLNKVTQRYNTLANIHDKIGGYPYANTVNAIHGTILETHRRLGVE